MTEVTASHDEPTGGRTRVWDPWVRLFHWSLVAAFFVAYFTGDSVGAIHEWAGHIALGLVAFRLLWGFVGSKHARFTDFVPGPLPLFDYGKKLLRGREPRYIGHNPAAAVMILVLLAAIIVISVSGWLLTTDWGWGSETIEQVHEWAVDITLIAITLHVLAAVYESFKHRENLIRAMFTGFKRR